jgi:hypothetical protein
MAPQPRKASAAPVAREEFEVDFFTKELGRPLQRQWLQRRLDDIHAASHHVDDDSARARSMPPREDRAG